MRIAIITSWFTDVAGGSGTAVFFNTFIDGLRSRNYDIDLIFPTLHSTDYIGQTLERFAFNETLPGDPRIGAAQVVIGFDYDGYALDPRNRPPMIASAHALFGDVLQFESEPIRSIVERQAHYDQLAMTQAERVTAGSGYATNRIVELYGVDPSRVHAIPHGMLPHSWLKYVDAAPRLPNDHPVIFAVGKMYPRKRTDILLRALPALIARYPNVELRIAGDGLEWDRLHALADELGINANLTWLGHVSDDAAFAREWRQADIFCHPSMQETFGYVYLEAMLLGKPIVAARAGAAPEVIGDAGVLVEPDNPAALAAALAAMIDDPQMRHAYAQRARLRAPLFTQARMIDGYAALIEELAHTHRGQKHIAVA